MEEGNLKDSAKSLYENSLGKNNPFREDEVGRKAFYPSGPFGKGYYIPSSEKQEEVGNFRQAMNGISTAVVVIGIFLGSLGNPIVWICVFIMLLILWLWSRAAMYKN